MGLGITARRSTRPAGRVHRRIDDDGARKPIAVKRARQDGDEAAEAVGDDNGRLAHFEHTGVFADGQLLVDKRLHRVIRAPVRITHA